MWHLQKLFNMSNYFTCSVTNRKYYARGVVHCNCISVIYLITCQNCLPQYIGSVTNFENRFKIHKKISRITEIDVGLHSVLMVSVKISAIFFSFCLFKLLNKFMEILQTLKKFYGPGENVGKASYLLRLSDLYCYKRKVCRK